MTDWKVGKRIGYMDQNCGPVEATIVKIDDRTIWFDVILPTSPPRKVTYDELKNHPTRLWKLKSDEEHD